MKIAVKLTKYEKALYPYSAQLHFFSSLNPTLFREPSGTPGPPGKRNERLYSNFKYEENGGRKCAYRAPEHFRAYVKSDEKAENIEGEKENRKHP